MIEPKVKKVNTISLRFVKGERSRELAKYILKDIFKLQPKDIFGIGNEGKASIHVKFRSTDVYNDISTQYHGEHLRIDLDEETTVQVIDVSTYSIKVSMKNVPFELSNTAIDKILQNYGSVNKVLLNSITDKDDWFYDSMTMERTAYMNSMKYPIPSTLLVNLTGTYIYFSYPRQIRTCNRCGSQDHTSPDCTVVDRKKKDSYIRPENRDNVINLEYDYDKEFPSMMGLKASTEQSHSDEETSDDLVYSTPEDMQTQTPHDGAHGVHTDITGTDKKTHTPHDSAHGDQTDITGEDKVDTDSSDKNTDKVYKTKMSLTPNTDRSYARTVNNMVHTHSHNTRNNPITKL